MALARSSARARTRRSDLVASTPVGVAYPYTAAVSRRAHTAGPEAVSAVNRYGPGSRSSE